MAEETWQQRSTRQAAAAARRGLAEDARQKARPMAERIYGGSYLDGNLQRRRNIASGVAKAQGRRK